ncbi:MULTISPECIES: diaminopimelate decarboxylase [unclassified Streptomyces]|uniref:diaminopimelate decarboxylase n=1 Tax=unclassified Streptomyces TaxID=2593676 RepID=UPI0022552306|nr:MULTISPECIES: diaminopimelate decarboxylase [unclassified Streptomyces]WSP56386.1 diaminopimelate decarboxylase [Streptomyces sp. NBC_01241]WSU22897.1 diaminopimelate decarboxylase [Streptomyces sp. NBC_01108]MCX4788116.1 diaminopimelate decarboxylase [Streptomyces sp. NBC_01221]MCX4796123.1 diaminopimelate decarboxylase [Streptomyces sp. NBC_01242]WSJ37382.1 diaminopimelate decarboxylase [Streptomyces sp. NBC_01321]
MTSGSAHQRGSARAAALARAVEDGLLGPGAPLVGLLDVDAVLASVDALNEAFDGPATVHHTFAAKACGLVPVLRLLADAGMGCEVASPGELEQALAAGFPYDRLVFDSPAKTVEELETALAHGIAFNLDNFQELARVDRLLAGREPAGPIGLRVNPQVGAGAIGAMSTATATSKFGVALRDPGAVDAVIDAFARRPWLNRLHAHVGSQGCPLPLIAQGIRAAYELAERINAQLGHARITGLDIGGGLSVNFAGEDDRPTYADYVAELRGAVPGLFDGRYTLVTEFGRSLLAKSGTIATVVEYTKSAGGRRIAVTHAGAQVAARTVFMPESWPLRVGVFDAAGRPKQGPAEIVDIAGPCCFAGDLTAAARELPVIEPGDVVALYDTGAYYFSSHFSYNSLPRPAVYGYRTGTDGRVRFALVREAQSMREVVEESGLAHADALVGLGTD